MRLPKALYPLLLLPPMSLLTALVGGIFLTATPPQQPQRPKPPHCLQPGLLSFLIISVSSGTVYVRSGEDITGCGMSCSGPHEDVTWELHTECGGKERRLLEHHCYYSFDKSHDPRIHLDPGNGCWKLTPARTDDTCVYQLWCYCDHQYLASSTDIRVLDPVLISNISSNCSRPGQDMAVSVQYTGEESAVTWEVDGEPLPERYRLIDDNRTLIIPSVQRDDTQRTFQVTITNPVSNETRDHRLEIRDPDPYRGRTALIIVGVSGILCAGISIISVICYWKKRTKHKTKAGSMDEENGSLRDDPTKYNEYNANIEEQDGPNPIKVKNSHPDSMNGSAPMEVEPNHPAPMEVYLNGQPLPREMNVKSTSL